MSSASLWLMSTIAARTLIVLLFIIVGLRLLGKRQIGQMNIYDLAMIMALANSVQNAMTSGKGNLVVGIASSGTLLVVGWAITLLFVRLPKLEAHVVGTPTLLINDGQILEEPLRREQVTHDNLMTVLRQHGLTEASQAMMAVLEVDGAISVVPKKAHHRRSDKKADHTTLD